MQIANIIYNTELETFQVITQPVVVGIHGKDAFEVWKEKENKPDGTYEEYKAAMTPQIDLEINEKGELIVTY